MKQNEYKDIEQLLQDTYGQQEVAPDSDLWSRIASQMETPAVQRGPWKKKSTELIIALASLTAVVTTILLVFPPSSYRQPDPIVAEVTTATVTEPSQSVAASTVAAAQPEAKTVKGKVVSSTTEPASSSSQLVAAPRTAANRPVVASRTTVVPSAAPAVTTVDHPAADPVAPSQPTAGGQTAPAPVTPSAPTNFPTVSLNIPNVITPNGDGINDRFDIEGIQDIDDLKLQIFDRRGHLLYTSNHYKGGYTGDGLEDGTYIYSLTSSSRGIQRRGSLLIKRK